MKKKVNVVYIVEFETTIEVDTDLPQCEVYFDEYYAAGIDEDASVIPEIDFYEFIDKVDYIKEQLSDIEIPESRESEYRKDSFKIINFQIL